MGNVRSLKAELDREGIHSPERKSLKGNSYGDQSFSRGSLYWILKNPAYIGKISHKGKIYEGLHEGIITTEIWEQAQLKLKEQTVERTYQTKRLFMLQGIVYDTNGTVYGPTYTSRHGRQYCYYISQALQQNKSSPNHIMARLPAHELENTIERSLRQEIRKLIDEEDGPVLEHILKSHEIIPAYDLIRACVEKIEIGINQLTIKVKTHGFQKMAQTHLGIKIQNYDTSFEIPVSFKMGRAKRGAIIIKPEGQDIFDLPSHKLKKLIQGVIWREEHFAGTALKDIAQREKCSEAYVGTAIFESFEFGKIA